MDKHIPYEKLSKKEKRKLDSSRRNSWGINPVTKMPENSRAYNRKKTAAYQGHMKRQKPEDEDI